MPRPGLEPGPLDPVSGTLTITTLKHASVSVFSRVRYNLLIRCISHNLVKSYLFCFRTSLYLPAQYRRMSRVHFSSGEVRGPLSPVTCYLDRNVEATQLQGDLRNIQEH